MLKNQINCDNHVIEPILRQHFTYHLLSYSVIHIMIWKTKLQHLYSFILSLYVYCLNLVSIAYNTRSFLVSLLQLLIELALNISLQLTKYLQLSSCIKYTLNNLWLKLIDEDDKYFFLGNITLTFLCNFYNEWNFEEIRRVGR